MPSLYFFNVTVHILAAFVWLGGMLFLGLVGAPALRGVEPAALRQQLFQTLGLRFRAVGWACIAILVVTGVINLHFRGWLRWRGVLDSMEFWETTAGRALCVKLAAVTVMIAVSGIHDFFLGPAAGRVEAGSPGAITLRRRAAWLARVNAVVGVVVVVAAVRLARS